MNENTLLATFKTMPRDSQLRLIDAMKADLRATLTPAIVADFPADLRARLAGLGLPA